MDCMLEGGFRNRSSRQKITKQDVAQHDGGNDSRGHDTPNLTLPLGALLEINAESGRVAVNRAVVHR